MSHSFRRLSPGDTDEVAAARIECAKQRRAEHGGRQEEVRPRLVPFLRCSLYVMEKQQQLRAARRRPSTRPATTKGCDRVVQC